MVQSWRRNLISPRIGCIGYTFRKNWLGVGRFGELRSNPKEGKKRVGCILEDLGEKWLSVEYIGEESWKQGL